MNANIKLIQTITKFKNAYIANKQQEQNILNSMFCEIILALTQAENDTKTTYVIPNVVKEGSRLQDVKDERKLFAKDVPIDVEDITNDDGCRSEDEKHSSKSNKDDDFVVSDSESISIISDTNTSNPASLTKKRSYSDDSGEIRLHALRESMIKKQSTFKQYLKI